MTPESSNGLARIREDVHIHAGIADVHRRLADPATHDEWLSHHFRDLRADDEGLSFTLALPLRAEPASLRRDGSEDRAITYVRDGGGVIDSLTWAIHVEGQRECHLTVEAAYHPSRGVIGGTMETLFYRPHRAQALRDSLWALKHLVEGRRMDA